MAEWIGVVTNAGRSLLAQWLGGGSLNIDSAAEGSGTVDIAALFAQTALVNQQKVISIISAKEVENGEKIKLRITSEGVTSGHVCNQIGLWASIDGGTSYLISIIQNTAGQPIPTYVEMPDFIWDFYAIVEMSNSGVFTLTINPNAWATANDLAEHNQDNEAHPFILDKLTNLEGLINEITTNVFTVKFDKLDGLTTTGIGIWNESMDRIEF